MSTEANKPCLLLAGSRLDDEASQAWGDALRTALDALGWSHAELDPPSVEVTSLVVEGAAQAIVRAAESRAAELPQMDAPLLAIALGEEPRALLRDLPLLALAARRGWPLVVRVSSARFFHAVAGAPRDLAAEIASHLGRALRIVVPTRTLAGLFHGLAERSRVVAVDPPVPAACERIAAGAWDRRAAGLLSLAREGAGGGLVVLSSAEADPELLLAAAAGDVERGGGHRFHLLAKPANVAGLQAAAPPNVLVLPDDDPALRYSLLARADALAYPTEDPLVGQPLLALEASRFGLPLVVGCAGGLADLVAEGENGLFLGESDPGALLSCLDELRDLELRSRMAVASRQRSRRHAPSTVGRALAALVEAALAASPAAER